MQRISFCKGAFHDFSSAALHRGHADPQFGREHPILLRPTGIKIRTPLQQITSIVGTGADSGLSVVLNQRKEVGPGFDPRHHFHALAGSPAISGRPAIQAQGEGFEVYFVTDASGGVSPEAHDMAVRRMVQGWHCAYHLDGSLRRMAA